MKKIAILVLCSLTAAMVTGYGPADVMGKTVSQSSSVSDVLAEQMAKADQEAEEDTEQDTEDSTEEASGSQEGSAGRAEAQGEEPEEEEVQEPVYEDIDVDLTILSSTMVYSEVYNMMVSPDTYLGKTVKMDGTFTYYYDEAADIYYYACIIQDATACCAQGIEFAPIDKYTYPDDFPEVGRQVQVTGVFDTYQEGEYQYCTLRNAVFDILPDPQAASE